MAYEATLLIQNQINDIKRWFTIKGYNFCNSSLTFRVVRIPALAVHEEIVQMSVYSARGFNGDSYTELLTLLVSALLAITALSLSQSRS